MKYKDVSGIYKISNTVNGKCYIGESVHCEYRKKQHYGMLRKGIHPNVHLQNAWNKYGEDSFEFSIIEECSETDLAEREKYWIKTLDTYKNGYNRSLGGDGTCNVEYSQERNKKISKTLTGRKRPELSRGNAPDAKRVVCLNTERIYECITDAAEELLVSVPSIIRACQTHSPVAKKYAFVYYEEYCCLTDDEKNIIVDRVNNWREIVKLRRSKSIVCLNTGDVYESVEIASKQFGASISYTHKCCKGLVASSGKDEYGTGLAWAYIDDYNNMSENEIANRIEIAINNSNKNRPVSIKCLNTNEVFLNVTSAAKKYGLNVGVLSKHIKGDKVWGVHPDTQEQLKWEIID